MATKMNLFCLKIEKILDLPSGRPPVFSTFRQNIFNFSLIFATKTIWVTPPSQYPGSVHLVTYFNYPENKETWKDLSLKDLIFECLKASKDYYSVNYKTGEYETSNGRLRSALDLWRHIKHFKPEVDIFSIMRVIYSMRCSIYGHYCTTVRRRVFRYYPNGNYNLNQVYDTARTDEFRLRFSDWQYIGLQEEKK